MKQWHLTAAALVLVGCGSATRSPSPPPPSRLEAATPAPSAAQGTPTEPSPPPGPVTHPPRVPQSLLWTYPDQVNPASMFQSPAAGAVNPVSLTFSPVTLPIKDPIGLIAGTGPNDVWLVSWENDVMRFDGRRARRLGKLCPDDGLYGAQLGQGMLRVRNNDLLLLGFTFTGTTPAPGVAIVPRSLPKACDFNYGSPVVAFAQSEDDVWRFEGDRVWTLSGATIPAPLRQGDVHASNHTALCVGSRQHAWLANAFCRGPEPSCYSVVWEYRGYSWVPRPPADFFIRRLWVDDRGSLWALGVNGSDPQQAGFRNVVAKLEHMEWIQLPLPEKFDAAEIMGRRHDDVWFVGAKHVYLHDGETIRPVPVPMEFIRTLWLEPSGEVWIGGEQPDEEGRPQGLVLRSKATKGAM
jgi:hypothetical protein